MARSPRWSKVLRDLTSHKARTLLVVLSIAVGVFAVTVVLGARQVLIREFDADFESSVAPSIEYQTDDFQQSVVEAVGARDDVLAAEGRRRITGRYVMGSKVAEGEVRDDDLDWQTMRLWALRDFGDIRVAKVVSEEGEWPPGPGEVVLERGALQVRDIEIGDEVSFESPAGTLVVLRVVGFAHDINAVPAQFQHALTGFVSMDTLPALGEKKEFNHLAIALDPSWSRSKAGRAAVDIRETELAAAGVKVMGTSVPEPGSHFLGDIFKALSLLLLAMGVMALALSAFLVVTTLSAIMTQQVRHVGIMKAIGGRRDQITRMYLALVTVYGAIAVVLGVTGGVVAGKWFTDFAARILNFRVVDYGPPLWVVLLVSGVGLLVPVLAALAPVRRGSLLPVAKALNDGGPTTTFGHGLLDRALGLLRGLPRPVALSLRNTFLRKGRLVLTLTTLVLASAVVMAVLTVRTSILSTVDDMSAWWHYDAQVFLGKPSPGDVVEAEAAKAKGVVDVETWLESPASFRRPDGSENEGMYVIGVPADSDFVSPVIESGRWIEAGADEIVINTDVAKDEPSLDVGDSVTLVLNGKKHAFELVGIASGQLMGPVVFADRKSLDSALGAQGAATRLLARSEQHGASAQKRIARDLESRLDEAGLSVSGTQTFQSQRSTIASQLGILVTFLGIMAGLLAAVGIIGLTGTMTINVLESTREIGVMRSIGASHGWVFYIFVTEGVVIAVMAWALGALLSWPFSIWLVDALGAAMNLPLSYRFSFLGVFAWLATVVVIASLASLAPAWRASQVSIRDAIAYE